MRNAYGSEWKTPTFFQFRRLSAEVYVYVYIHPKHQRFSAVTTSALQGMQANIVANGKLVPKACCTKHDHDYFQPFFMDNENLLLYFEKEMGGTATDDNRHKEIETELNLLQKICAGNIQGIGTLYECPQIPSINWNENDWT